MVGDNHCRPVWAEHCTLEYVLAPCFHARSLIERAKNSLVPHVRIMKLHVHVHVHVHCYCKHSVFSIG